MERLEIINAVRREVEGVEQGGFPLRVFPQAMQKIILDWEHDEGYVVEFSAMAMLSAISTALGNALAMRVRNSWVTSAPLYVILVGRPGLGKTPPLKTAFAPIRKRDAERLRVYCSEMELYEAANKENMCDTKKPKLVRFVVNDFTPEAMFEAHYNNLRGIVILVDEIIGMFNSANRYSNGPLIEQLLSAWSGSPITVIRKSCHRPLHIEQPCINIIGTIQSRLVSQLVSKGYKDNGLLDRFVLLYPVSQKMRPWALTDTAAISIESAERWDSIIGKVLDIPCDVDEQTGNVNNRVLEMDDAAKRIFYDWWNEYVAKVNAIKDDNLIDDRSQKRNAAVARYALLFQVAKWACGEGHVQFIDEDSIKSAISLNDYIEDSYARIKEIVEVSAPVSRQEAMLDSLPDTFETKDAIEYGKTISVTDKTVKNWLKSLVGQGRIRHEKHGTYCKIVEAADAVNGDSETENTQFPFSFSSLSSLSDEGKGGEKCKREESEKGNQDF